MHGCRAGRVWRCQDVCMQTGVDARCTAQAGRIPMADYACSKRMVASAVPALQPRAISGQAGTPPSFFHLGSQRGEKESGLRM